MGQKQVKYNKSNIRIRINLLKYALLKYIVCIACKKKRKKTDENEIGNRYTLTYTYTYYTIAKRMFRRNFSMTSLLLSNAQYEKKKKQETTIL